MSDIEYIRDGKGRVEARDEERAPGVVGRGASEAKATQELEKAIVSTWHPKRAGRIQESLDCLLDGGHPNREAILELQRFFDDSIGLHRAGSEAWASQSENANERSGGSYTNQPE